MKRCALIALSVLALFSGCGTTDKRQWMKLSQQYTVEEFRRDYKDCSPTGKLDDACMRNRGWVDMAGQDEKQQQTDPRGKYVSPGRR
jgi:hypothetical protein